MGSSQSDLSARVLIASSLAWVVAMAWNQAISGFLHHWIEERVDRELKAQGALSGYEQLPLLVYACIITLVVAAFATLWPVDDGCTEICPLDENSCVNICPQDEPPEEEAAGAPAAGAKQRSGGCAAVWERVR